jgi:2-(1,2-epoxy-1,2-dihydrophenyl)acetyl-CoA isomerase
MTEHRSYDELVAGARQDERELVTVERDSDRAIVRMSDPTNLNALSAPLTLQLQDALNGLVADRDLRTVVLTGEDPAFSAGGDLELMRQAHANIDGGREGTTMAWRWIRWQFGGVVRTIAKSDKVFVAAVNGAAAGVGMAFALASDIILASERAQFVPAFMKIGLLPEVGTSWLLTRRIGYQRTFELFAGGAAVSGEEAARLGIANAVVGHDELIPRALDWCDRVSALPEHAVLMTKPLLRAAADMSWDQALAMEEFAEPGCFTTGDHRDAVEAFLAR